MQRHLQHLALFALHLVRRRKLPVLVRQRLQLRQRLHVALLQSHDLLLQQPRHVAVYPSVTPTATATDTPAAQPQPRRANVRPRCFHHLQIRLRRRRSTAAALPGAAACRPRGRCGGGCGTSTSGGVPRAGGRAAGATRPPPPLGTCAARDHSRAAAAAARRLQTLRVHGRRRGSLRRRRRRRRRCRRDGGRSGGGRRGHSRRVVDLRLLLQVRELELQERLLTGRQPRGGQRGVDAGQHVPQAAELVARVVARGGAALALPVLRSHTLQQRLVPHKEGHKALRVADGRAPRRRCQAARAAPRRVDDLCDRQAGLRRQRRAAGAQREVVQRRPARRREVARHHVPPEAGAAGAAEPASGEGTAVGAHDGVRVVGVSRRRGEAAGGLCGGARGARRHTHVGDADGALRHLLGRRCKHCASPCGCPQ
eukprot:Rhum_TRINITY_DN9235_c0_g1::Rhum_TRINITY_DN9235_c0_g1_i1::g.32445::m.32445